MKKITAILLVAVLILSLCACGEKEADDEGHYTIGICQLVQHTALDAATEGFMDAVKEGLGEDNVTFLNQNASGESSSCTTIVNGFVAKNVDLIMANATPALQAAVAATTEIPILGTSITHYAPALDIDPWTGTVGGNISGTSDLADLKAQASMIKEWFPETQKVAIIYCNSEANSIYQAQEVGGYLKDMGIEVKEYTFTDTNDVASVTLAACNYADVIYIPTDNVAAANSEAIGNVVYEQKVPVITGDTGTCEGCGVATIAIDYYDLGVATGKMAVRILKDGEDISKMAIETAPEYTAYYNPKACEILGITPLAGYISLE